MRNKKTIMLTAIVLLLVLLFTVALFGCRKKEDNPSTPSGDINNSGDNNPSGTIPLPPGPPSGDGEDEDIYYSGLDAFQYIAKSLGGQYVSMTLNGGVELNGKKYILDGKLNVSENDASLAVKLIDEGQQKVAYAFYIVDSKLYVEVGEGGVYHISEIDTEYLSAIIEALPTELKALIEDLLAGLDLGGMSINLDSIIKILMNAIAPNVEYSNDDNGTETFVIELQPYKALSTIVDLVKQVAGKIEGIDQYLQLASDIIALVPAFDGKVDATIVNGSLSSIGMDIYNKDEDSDNYGQVIVGMNTSITTGNEALDLELPQAIADGSYDEFSLTNLNADFSFALDTDGKDLDLGALIDSFLGEDKKIFGEGTLMLNAGVSYTLEAKVNLDVNLDGLAEDNNLISLVLKADGNDFVKAYYYEGKIYINVQDTIKVAVDFDLQAQIGSLVELITNAIDGFLGTQFRPQEGEVATISMNAEGEAIISADLQTIITKILGMVGFEEFVSVDGDSISLNVNQAFIDKIIAMTGSTTSFELPGSANLLIQLGSMGLDYVEITANMFGANIALKAENFSIGTSDLTKENVAQAIGDTASYADGIAGIITSLFGGLNADVVFDLTTGESGLDVGALVDSFLDTPLFGAGVFMLNANMNYQLSLKAKLDATQGVDNNLISIALTSGEDVIATINYVDGMFYANIQDNIKVAVAMNLSEQIAKLVELIENELGGILSANNAEQVSLAEEGQSSNVLSFTLTNEVLNRILALAGVNAINFDQNVNIRLEFGSASIDSLSISLLDGMAKLTAQNLSIGNTDLTKEGVEAVIGDKESYKTIDSVASAINAVLGGLNADLTLAVHTSEEGFDLGAFVDSFIPDTPIFGAGVLVLKASVDYSLSLKAKLDATQGEDNNIINVVLNAGDKQVLAVNYQSGKIYINVEDIIKVAIDFDLAAQLNNLVSIIENALGSLTTQDSASAVSLASEPEQSQNNLTIKVTKELLNKILEMAGVTNINFDEEININLGFGGASVDKLEVSMLDGTLKLSAHNFLIGNTTLTKEEVEASIGDKSEYGSDVMGIVDNLFSDFSASVAFTMNTIDTTINLTSIINNILVKTGSAPLAIPLQIDFSKYSGTFTINFAINQGDVAIDNRLMLEVITPSGEMLISAYAINGKTYVDLTNLGLMKFALTNMDLIETFKSLLGITAEDSNQAVAMADGEINIDNTTITASLQSQFMLKFFRMLALDLGFDIALTASANTDGSVNANIDTGFMNADLGLTIGKESDDPVSTDKINVLDYSEYNALNAEVLVDSILYAQQLFLTLDLYNNNCDSEWNKDTRIVIRRSTAAAPGQSETLSNGLAAPYRSIVIGLYQTWSYNSGDVLIWVVLDVDANKFYIKGTKTLFSLLFGAATGELINLNFDMDIRTMLVGLVGGLLGDGSTGGGTGGGDNIIDVPEGALPEQQPDSGNTNGNEGIADGTTESASIDINSIFKMITLQLTGSLDVNVNLDLNGPYLSNFITTILTNLFEGGLDISSITNNEAHKNVVVNYDNVNGDVFFTELFDKIIVPIVEANVSLVGGLAADMLRTDIHSLVERFLPLPYVDVLTANVALTQGKIANITMNGIDSSSTGWTGGPRGFGIYLFNKKADDVVSWQGQDTQVYYNKNMGIDPASLFVKQARKHTSGNWETGSFANVVWTIDGNTISDWNVLSGYEDGKYTAIGTAFGDTISVEITVHSANISSIKDIYVGAMRDVPDYVTAVFDDGSERIISGVTINYTRGEYGVNRATKSVPANVVINGQTYEFNIIFEDETLSIDTLTVDAYSFKQVFDDMTNSGYAKVNVKNEFYKYMTAQYDFSQFDGKTSQDMLAGGTYEVPVTVGIGTDKEQVLTMQVVFTPFEVYGIEIDGKSYVETDIYDYIAGDAFPETVTVVGFNGTDYVRYTAKATWDTTNVIFDKTGGQYIASVVLNQGEYNEWTIPSVIVDVQVTDLAGLVNDTITLDTMYYFYGGVAFDRLIPGYMDFYTADGDIKKHVPVSVDTSSITPTLSGGSYVCNVTVGQGEYMYTTTVNVVLPDVTMSLLEENKTITMTYEEYVGSNGNMFGSYMDIMLGDNEVRAKVTWFTDNVVFNEVGTYTAYVIIDEGGAYEQMCAVTVNIVAGNEEV